MKTFRSFFWITAVSNRLKSDTPLTNGIMWITQRLGLLVLTLHIQFAGAQTEATQEFFIPQSQIEDFGTALGIAPSSPPRSITKLGVSLVKEFEGWMPKAYDDPVGYCTIGYGHLIALKSCGQSDLGPFTGTLTLERGEEILELDTRTARTFVQKLVKIDLTDQQFSALASFVFNVGKGNFADSTLLRHVNDKNHILASKEFLRWIQSKGKPFEGLRHRRYCEATLYENKLIGSKTGEFVAKECKPPPGIATSPVDQIDITKGEVRLPR